MEQISISGLVVFAQPVIRRWTMPNMYVNSTQSSQKFSLRRFWTLILSPNYTKVIILGKKPWQD